MEALAHANDFYVPSWKELTAEFAGARMLARSGLRYWWKTRYTGRKFDRRDGDEEVIVLGQGFGATNLPYYEVAQRLSAATGLPVVFLQVAENRWNANVGTLKSAIRLITAELQKLADKGVKRIWWVGHSMSGIQGCIMKRTLGLPVKIMHVFTIASPVRDTTWRLLQLTAELCLVAESPLRDIPHGLYQIYRELRDHTPTRLLPPELLAMREELEDEGDEFTALSYTRIHDFVAPRERCYIPNGIEVVLDAPDATRKPRLCSPRALLTHSGIPLNPMAIRRVAHGINDRRRRQVA